MKNALLLFLIFFGFAAHAQDCDYAEQFTDSLGTYKSTRDYLMCEKNFGGKSAYIFLKLINASGTPIVSFQSIQKSSDFIKAICFDASSRLFLQLENGRIVTLVHTADESCGTMVRIEEENKYSRLLSGNFLFIQGGIEDLESSPVSLLRVKAGAESIDYVIRKEMTSELTGKTTQPSTFFMQYLKCITD